MAKPSSTSRRSPGARGLLALGWKLALDGPLAKVSVGIAVATTFGGVVMALVVAHGDRSEGLSAVPVLASSALAYGAGTLLAFAASVHAFRLDRDRGIRALVAARARSDSEYLWARVIGLTRVLAAVTALATAVVGFAACLAARGSSIALQTLENTGASVAFSLAFAMTLAPVALATLGARSRIGGYIVLLFVLGLPELMQGWLTHVLPEGWGELVSIPGALGALRASLVFPGVDLLRFTRALAVLALVVALALLAVRAQLARFDQEPAA